MKSTHKIRFSAITQLKGIFSCFLLTSVISLNVSAQEIDCEKVKNKMPTFVRKGAISLEMDDSTRLDMKIFETCGGWDTVDNKIFQWPNIITIILDYGDIVEDETYGQILRAVNRYKASDQYLLDRNEIMLEVDNMPEELRKTENQPVSTLGSKTELVLEPAQKKGVFYKLDNLTSAIEAGKLQQKRVLIYFTGWACVNARKIEDRILIDKNIQALLAENYLCFSAYTDDRAVIPGTEMTIGEKNAQLQMEQFKSITQPYFYVLDETGKVIAQSAYVLTTGEFEAFLKKGLK